MIPRDYLNNNVLMILARQAKNMAASAAGRDGEGRYRQPESRRSTADQFNVSLPSDRPVFDN
jgi:hypothetical protein